MTKTKKIESFQITKYWESWDIITEKLKENLIELKIEYLESETNTNYINEEAEQLMKITENQ